MKRRIRHDDKAVPPPELAGPFNPRRWVTQAEMDEADRWDLHNPTHPGLTASKSAEVQLDAFRRWMADRARWAEEHGWTTEEMKEHGLRETA